MTEDSQESLHDSFPAITDKLLKALREAFPSRSPTLGTPEAQIWYSAGQAQVADFLELVQRRQKGED